MKINPLNKGFSCRGVELLQLLGVWLNVSWSYLLCGSQKFGQHSGELSYFEIIVLWASDLGA